MSDAVTKIMDLMQQPSIDINALEVALDAATHDERVAASRLFTGKLQRRLFDAAEGRPVTMEQMVPTNDPLREVIHVGTNTLPAFRHFEKRFARPASLEPNRAVGYNHNWYWQFTTPGYYVAYQDETTGEMFVDYTQLPTERVETWPPIMSNSSRLGLVIFAGMVDRLRRVSEHVTIGRAYKKKAMNAWFVLVRDDRF